MKTLPTITTEFEQIRDVFQKELYSNPVWKDMLVGSVGQIFMDWVAGIGASDQYAIQRGVQDAFMETANDTLAIYTMSRTLGARILRKRGSKVLVSLYRGTEEDPTTYENPLTIPAYSKFTIKGLSFFNPATIIFPAKTRYITGTDEDPITLCEGEEVVTYFESNGLPHQSFYVGRDFNMDDAYVRVRVRSKGVVSTANDDWSRITDSFWNHHNQEKIFRDLTTQYGEVEIQFGDGVYGYIPTVGSVVEVYTYAVNGSSSNTSSANLAISCMANSSVTGVTTSAIMAGDDEISAESYRSISPRLFAAQHRAVTRDDNESLIMTYPGVVDCKVIGEYEGISGTSIDYTPTEPAESWRNRVGIYLLVKDGSGWEDTVDSLGSTELTASQALFRKRFLNWYNGVKMMGVYPVLMKCNPVPVTVQANIICLRSSYLEQVKLAVESCIISFFEPKRNHLGEDFYLNDLVAEIESVDGVAHSYVSVVSSVKTLESGKININFDEYTKLVTPSTDLTITAVYK